jgi:hypothetical protein
MTGADAQPEAHPPPNVELVVLPKVPADCPRTACLGVRAGQDPAARLAIDRSARSAAAANDDWRRCEAMGKFALAYADQAERDHAALKAAVRAGVVDVQLEH